MKVLDLQCAHGHTFEGWFASEDDFQGQCERFLVQCPLCGDASVVKKPSAPRLNLGGKRVDFVPNQDMALAAKGDVTPTAAWLAVARQVLANTTDVGNRFADEARKMHYGETEERSIRGKATPQEAQALVDEGVDVVSFLLPEALKGTLQ